MVQKIDLLMPPPSQYYMLQSITNSFCDALDRCGIICRVLKSTKEKPEEFLDQLLSSKPDCTLSFNGLLPDSEGNFLADLIDIPHIACLLESPQHFITLIQSKNTIITCADRFGCDFFQGLNFPNALFMPNAVDIKLIHESNDSKSIDLLMLGSYIDFEAIEEKWNRTPLLGKIWRQAADACLEDRELSIVYAVAHAMDANMASLEGIDVSKIDFLEVMDEIKDFNNGRDRLELVKAIKKAKLTLVGAGQEQWKKHLQDHQNITFMPAMPFSEAIELMRKSKVVLNSSPAINYGVHERVLLGIASGAAVITDENLFLEENFNRSLLFYHPHHIEKLEETIGKYLHDEKARSEMVEKGQALIKRGHTWDHRAATLVNELQPILAI